ncbi:S1 RNA-binding domain-containing protein [Candidatus Pacearchaeota archaeon]|nr:MAG: S1 RNA-binding domain-containing protein [Candidatus Pacearchaeota archaeon]
MTEGIKEEIQTRAKERKVVVPGEVVVSGDEYLPGEYTRREGENILAIKFGLADISGRVVKIIPLFGAFIPRKNNVVIGRVTDITYAGWLVDIDSALSAFLPLEEAPRYVNRSEMDAYLDIGDVIAAKIWSAKSKSVDLSMKGRGLGKLEDGFIFRIIPSRVPRVIGKEGTMVNLIKDKTGCKIIVGQNGWIWVKGKDMDSEIKARKAIEFVADNVSINGLTEKVEEWFEKYDGS